MHSLSCEMTKYQIKIIKETSRLDLEWDKKPQDLTENSQPFLE